MRSQLRLPAPMASVKSWGTWFLLALGMLPQAMRAAEQRSLLRSGRAAEAIPMITLPQSLLLQSSDEEQGRAKVDATRVGSGNGLWSALQDGANEVVEDAREAFFADPKKATAAPTTVAPTTAAPTTTAMTTVDPAILAKQLKITKDAAQARNMLVTLITRAQFGLMDRLKEIGGDLDATELRAKQDLKAINHSFVAVQNMPIMASNADVDVKKIESNGNQLKAALPVMVARGKSFSKQIVKLMKEKKELEENLKKSKKLPGAKRRVQNNQQTLGVLVPRLENLERRVTKLEGQLYDGDLKKLVDDSTSKEVTNIMEDVSRGFGRFIANK